MLKELHIKNIAVIDEVRLEFGSGNSSGGFAALTGETGAGKSILIDSINMVLGERTSRDLVRSGADVASVNAVFEVTNPQVRAELGNLGIEIEDDDMVILSRDLSAEGKGSCRINGRTSTLSVVREIGSFLLNIHGQHDNQTLLKPKTHITFVDKFGGLDELVKKYSVVYKQVQEISKKIEVITANEAEKAQRLEFLRFQIEEIEDAKLVIGEDVELNEQCEMLNNIEKISDSVRAAHGDIYSADERTAHDLLSNAVRELENAARFDKRISPFYESVNSILIELREVSIDIASYIDSIEFDPQDQERAQSRANLIFNLKRKYGGEIEDILAHYKKISQEASEIENSDEVLDKLKLELHTANESMQKFARDLSAKRRKAAKELEEKITSELEDLDMKRVRFSVKVEDLYGDDGEIRYSSTGQDDAEFMISANVGEDLKPLSKIASGGEMSRIMLAIKSILSDSDTVDTLIFDEIDAGVSGRAAQKIAEKICKISRNKLIICVTHLAQLAAMSDWHYLVEKGVQDEKTSTKVIKLDKAGRTYELARIIGGVTVTDLTLQNADEMLRLAEGMKR